MISRDVFASAVKVLVAQAKIVANLGLVLMNNTRQADVKLQLLLLPA